MYIALYIYAHILTVRKLPVTIPANAIQLSVKTVNSAGQQSLNSGSKGLRHIRSKILNEAIRLPISNVNLHFSGIGDSKEIEPADSMPSKSRDAWSHFAWVDVDLRRLTTTLSS